MKKASNITLIGMPGVGKSTIGVLLAKHTARDFLDTDLLIQHEGGMTLQEIVVQQGYRDFLTIEEQVLCRINVNNHVIATGGSAVRSENAMNHLRASGVTVYLKNDPATLADRVAKAEARGIAMKPGQSFEALYRERSNLYLRFADATIDCSGLTPEETLKSILQVDGWHR